MAPAPVIIANGHMFDCAKRPARSIREWHWHENKERVIYSKETEANVQGEGQRERHLRRKDERENFVPGKKYEGNGIHCESGKSDTKGNHEEGD